jgi:type IV pilus assembly protein PilM
LVDGYGNIKGMKLLKGVGDFFAVDVGTSAIRIVELKGGEKKGWSLEKVAYQTVDRAVAADTSEEGGKAMAVLVAEVAKKAGIKTKNVAVGLPAGKTYAAVVEIDTVPPKELKNSIEFQLDQFVPMAIDEAKVDYVIIGESPANKAKTEALISSTSKAYAEQELSNYESAGLNVVAFEPAPIAAARSLMPIGATDAWMIVDCGELATDLIIVYKGFPRLARSVMGGMSVFTKAVATNLNLDEAAAKQYLLKYGTLADQNEGQVLRAVDSSLSDFATELMKSANFFKSKYAEVKIGGVILAGFAAVTPGMAEYLKEKMGMNVVRGNPWQAVKLTDEQRAKIAPVASEFAVAIGIAERNNRSV